MAIELQLSAGPLQPTVRALATIARQYDRIARSQERLARAGTPALAAGAATAPAPMGAAAARGPRTPRAQRFLSGPNQRLRQLAEQEQRAQQIRDPEERASVMRDLQILRFRAERSRVLGERRLAQGDEALRAPGLLDLFQTLNRRMGLGGGTARAALPAMAGGANGAAAAGGAAAVGGGAVAAAASAAIVPLVAVVGLAAAGFATLLRNTLQAAEALMQLRGAAIESGGTPEQIARLRALGISPDQIAGMAGGLRQRMATDAFAMQAGANLGIQFPMQRPFGVVDEAQILQQAFEGLRKITDQEEQLRQARMLGLDKEVQLLRVSDQAWERMRRAGDLLGEVASEDQIFKAAELTAAQRELGTSWEALKIAFMEPFLEPLTIAARELAEVLQWAARNANALSLVLFPGPRLIGELLKRHGGDDEDGEVSAIDRNTRALERNTDAIMRPGLHGGGQRARTALPRFLRPGEDAAGFALEERAEANALRMGAFGSTN